MWTCVSAFKAAGTSISKMTQPPVLLVDYVMMWILMIRDETGAATITF